jgi:hypothetical protein
MSKKPIKKKMGRPSKFQSELNAALSEIETLRFALENTKDDANHARENEENAVNLANKINIERMKAEERVVELEEKMSESLGMLNMKQLAFMRITSSFFGEQPFPDVEDNT